MRVFYIILLFTSIATFGQNELNVHDTVPVYSIDESLIGVKTFQIPLSFNEEFIYSNLPDSLKDLAILRIDLAYTTFKSNASFDQNKLNESRMNNLFEAWPSTQNNIIDWRLIGQNAAILSEDAKEFFHGFTIYYRPKPTEKSIEEEINFLDDIFGDFLSEPVVDKMDSTTTEYWGETRGETSALPALDLSEGAISKIIIDKGDHCEIQYVKYFNEERKPRKRFIDSLKSSDKNLNVATSFNGIFFRGKRSVSWQVKLDSCPEKKISPIILTTETIEKELTIPAWLTKGDYGIVEAVFSRKSEWKNTLIVMDVTGSMSPYIAQTMAWLRNTQSSDYVAAFTFFNDGDRKPEKLKRIGNTGGIYSVDNIEFAEVYGKMKYTMRQGSGGDCPENNVEATLKTIENHPEFDEIVMVADNYATPRDLAIAKQVSKPIHVILCGANSKINLAYIQLAYDTGGSVHTIEEDMDMRSIKEGIKFKIGNSHYTLSKGRIVKG
ncbi:MAG: hypothetical protein ACI8ZM_004996 [Crocinitomix sp.]|jgi:hypothetical protein